MYGQKTHQKLVNLLITALLSLTPMQVSLAEYNSMLAPTSFTPTAYRTPKYDIFDHDYYRTPVLPTAEPDTAPQADFNIYTDQQGLPDNRSGTTTTKFTFDASASIDAETDSSQLEARWDFENDGIIDSYFSLVKSITHIFPKTGVYQVKLQILDRGGNISSIIKKITIVDSTAPFAYYRYEPATGTAATVFHFDTRLSRDDQYLSSALQYRFDWDGDSKWDTKFQNKIDWNHKFPTAGVHHVIMEVKDPEGLTARVAHDVVTVSNTLPSASFIIQSIPASLSATYQFDASASSDQETPKNRLLYRWDFNYGGSNDIVYDTNWSSAAKFTGTYSIPGHKVIRLAVMDQDGTTSYAYAAIDVPWTGVVMQQIYNQSNK